MSHVDSDLHKYFSIRPGMLLAGILELGTLYSHMVLEWIKLFACSSLSPALKTKSSSSLFPASKLVTVSISPCEGSNQEL